MGQKDIHGSSFRKGTRLPIAPGGLLLVVSLALCLVLLLPVSAGATGARETVISLPEPRSSAVSQDDLSSLESLEHGKTPAPEDRDLARKIAQEIKDDPFIESKDIEVTVIDGIAVLRGTVKSWPEYAAATADALQCGAREVENRLQVMEETMIAGHRK
ncbi:MAG: BON domain-containing protein [Deltaproteobacteria bacterium]|nr:BON domain-containing protein [Deltaproteobacteria bacterium]